MGTQERNINEGAQVYQQDELDFEVQRSMAIFEAVETACADDVSALATVNLEKLRNGYIKQAEAKFRDEITRSQGKFALRQIIGSPTYEQERLARAEQAATNFDTESSLGSKAARMQALQGLVTGIYGKLIDANEIEPESVDVEKLTPAVKAIRDSFAEIGPDGRPKGGLDRAGLKKRLDAAGISNTIRIINEQEQTEIQRNNDIKRQASELGLAPERYSSLLQTANIAYARFTTLGPFYGKDEKDLPPTFRITGEPIKIPERYKEQIAQTGYDILALGQALPALPDRYKAKLGNDIFYGMPLTWRVDSILDTNGQLKINEVQIDDGAEALMIGEQLAYGLQDLSESTAAYISNAIQNRCNPVDGPIPYRMIRVMQNVEGDPYTPNARRFKGFIEETSNGCVTVEPVDRRQLKSVDWSAYAGVFSSAYIRPSEYLAAGVPNEKLLAAGECTALGNKGVFALLYDDELNEFWKDKIGSDSLVRLQKLFIPSTFVETTGDMWTQRQAGRVVKIYDSPKELSLLDTGKGVAGPWSTDKEWQILARAMQDGCKVIDQKFVEPTKLSTFVRGNGGTTLEPMEGYNRFCLKYVAQNPLDFQSPVALTAIEVTIGRNMKPSSRDCTFTPGIFVSENQ